MKVTLTVESDELKLAQLLAKFAEKYRMSYKLKRQAKGFQLELELNSDDFGELVRRLNHLKDASFKIMELRGGGLLDKFNVTPTRTEHPHRSDYYVESLFGNPVRIGKLGGKKDRPQEPR